MTLQKESKKKTYLADDCNQTNMALSAMDAEEMVIDFGFCIQRQPCLWGKLRLHLRCKTILSLHSVYHAPDCFRSSLILGMISDLSPVQGLFYDKIQPDLKDYTLGCQRAHCFFKYSSRHWIISLRYEEEPCD